MDAPPCHTPLIHPEMALKLHGDGFGSRPAGPDFAEYVP